MFSEQERDQFFNMVDSLKKSQRADLKDISRDEDIIKNLYVDPLQNEFIYKSVSNLNNSILLGRKGTGKSTILARLQNDLYKDKKKIFVYIDVKSIYDKVTQTFFYDLKEQLGEGKTQNIVNKYLFYKQFTIEFIDALKIELKNNITSKIPFTKNADTIIREIEESFNKIENSSKEDLDLIKEMEVSQQVSLKEGESGKLSSTLSSKPSLGGELSFTSENNEASTVNYSSKILRIFPFMQVMSEIRGILKKNGLEFLFIAFDDFSELDEETMKIFVDIIISPLNNSLYDFYKIKVCAYPYRCFLGNIDPTKIDPIKLDYYELYSSDRIDKIEKDATDFVKRLLESRAKYFLGKSFDEYLDLTKNGEEAYYDLLFKTSSAIPRNLGWILWYTYRSSIDKNKKITLSDISNAAENYYVDIIERYLSRDVYLKCSYDERLIKHEIKEMLDLIKNLARKNKAEIKKSTAKIFKDYGENPPTSHFFIDKKLENILHTLELNFFISKITDQKDQDSQDIMSFYNLNYGLCQKENIGFGKGNDRKYRIQRRFNYTSELEAFVNNMKEIVCDNCKATYTMEAYEKLAFYDMMCPKCKRGICHIENKFDYSVFVPKVDNTLQLLNIEFDFLNSIRITGPQPAKELAQDLDISYQKITRVADKLEEMSLIIRQIIKNRTYYSLTEKANKTYFNED